MLQSSIAHIETLLFFFVTRPRWLNTEVVAIWPSANNTDKTTTIPPAGFCAPVPGQNLLAFTFLIRILIISTLVKIYGLLNDKSFFHIRKICMFQNITNSRNVMLLEFCTSTAMVVYCLLSIWFSSNTLVAIVVFQVTYMFILVYTIRCLARWGLVLRSMRKYAMTTAAINVDFNPIFRILVYFFLVFVAVLQRIRVHDVAHNSGYYCCHMRILCMKLFFFYLTPEQ